MSPTLSLFLRAFLRSLCIVTLSFFTMSCGNQVGGSADVSSQVTNSEQSPIKTTNNKGCSGTGKDTSALWGKSGELWDSSPNGRLPNFAYAGYASGREKLPRYSPVVNVKKDFNAKGDGITDDTVAVRNAIAAASNGAVYFPPGRYRLTDVLFLDKSNIALRGAGPNKTTLFFDTNLKYLNNNSPQFSSFNNNSWFEHNRGGFIWVGSKKKPSSSMVVNGKNKFATVTKFADRTTHQLTLSNTGPITVGSYYVLKMINPADNSLVKHVYNDRNNAPSTCSVFRDFHWSFKVTAKNGNQITIQQPLPLDVRPGQWTTEVYEPTDATVHGVGVERLRIEFPDNPYPGHHNEEGTNCVYFNTSYDGYVDDVECKNADNGLGFASGAAYITVDGFKYLKRDTPTYSHGHYCIGMSMGAHHILVQSSDCSVRTQHSLSTQQWSNHIVFRKTKAVNLDHHGEETFANLYSRLNLTEANANSSSNEYMYHSGAVPGCAEHNAAWSTYWNIDSEHFVEIPKPFLTGHANPTWINYTTNIVGADTTVTTTQGKHQEKLDRVEPPDLYCSFIEFETGSPPIQ